MDAFCTRRSALRGPLVVTAAALALANASGAAAQAECTGGNAIGISLDSSGSVRSEFPIISQQIVAFVNSTSGLTSSGDANRNQYYINTFSARVTDSTGSFATNDGGAVSDAVDALSPDFGNTDIRSGIEDLELMFGSAPSSAVGIAIVFTDGRQFAPSPIAEADALRAAGITVAAVGIGSINTAVLEDIASERTDGSEIVFTGSNFEEIGDLFSSVIRSIDTDGDGVDDCADGCPEDPDKVAPGQCGCGVPEGCNDDPKDDMSCPELKSCMCTCN